MKDTQQNSYSRSLNVEDTIQNGVKGIKNDNNNPHSYHHKWTIDWVVQNGVKNTRSSEGILNWNVEDAIQNGFKEDIKK